MGFDGRRMGYNQPIWNDIWGCLTNIGKPPHLMVGWVMFTSLLWSLVQPYILPDSHRLDTGRGSSRGGWYHSRLDLHWQGPLQELTQHEWHGEMVLWSQKVATACVNYEPLLCIRGSIPLSAGVISGFFLKSSFLAFPFKAFLALHNSLHDTTTSLLYNYNNHTYWHGMNFYQISVCAYVRIHLVVFPFPFPNMLSAKHSPGCLIFLVPSIASILGLLFCKHLCPIDSVLLPVHDLLLDSLCTRTWCFDIARNYHRDITSFGRNLAWTNCDPHFNNVPVLHTFSCFRYFSFGFRSGGVNLPILKPTYSRTPLFCSFDPSFFIFPFGTETLLCIPSLCSLGSIVFCVFSSC